MTMGTVDKASIKDSDVAKHAGGGDADKTIVADGNKPGLNGCINIYDFEAIASRVCPEQGWVYYSSGSDDEITLRENHNAFHRIWSVWQLLYRHPHHQKYSCSKGPFPRFVPCAACGEAAGMGLAVVGRHP